MASRAPNDGSARPDVGEILMVIHDFHARSSDELSLKKGDRVELLERDDEFGDGWFLGRHLANSNTGLFPEVYTRPPPRAVSNPMPTPAFISSQPLSPLVEVTQETALQGIANAPASASTSAVPLSPSETPSALPTHLLKTQSAPASGLGGTGSPASALGGPTTANTGQDEVLSETLNVIDEHITHLQSPPGTSAMNAAATDSGSEYSVAIDHRMSYIQGEETDEEEDAVHTRAEVEAWSPDDVAEYLFTEGVEKHHCEVFRDQEISGEVLLGMDQSSLFIKDFDLGSVGRRLKTWQKIKTLQDEVSGEEPETKRATYTRGSDGGSEDAKRTRSRTSTLTGNSISRPTSVQARRLSLAHSSSKASPTAHMTPTNGTQESPSRTHLKRPSAASIRDLNHSRRHSSTEFRLPGSGAAAPKAPTNANLSAGDGVHKKQPSFDRNWTLGGAITQTSQRPLSSTGLQEMLGVSEPDLQDSAVELDRGYFSGTEVDGRKRNVLRKRDSANHRRQQSYADEQRVRSATALSRHSRYGSVDSFRDGTTPSAAQKYYGIQPTPHKRTASSNTTDSARPPPPAKDGPAPTVTKLDTAASPVQVEASPVVGRPQGLGADWLTSVTKPVGKATRPAMRAISDKLTFERSKVVGSADLSTNESSMPSPVRTGSSTPSAGQSLDLESRETLKSPVTATAPSSKSNRKKGKKETSAYTQGLLKLSPRVAMKDADYYGWMKKKSSNLMTTWKPRFFVLKGRRLAYYYSEDDDQEKGLIDISFHRVLPADNERLTGLHATLTGAAGGPSMPGSHSKSPAGDDGEALEKGDDTMFIFKLVPPRAGLSKGVSFTKPTVHYFAVPNLKQGRLWMAALMKSTIERDDTQPITTTYQQKTISLAKAKQMRHRPPALMNAEDPSGAGAVGEADSGISGVDKLAALKIDGARLDVNFGDKDSTLSPLSA
ncbi:hypothetical protein V8C37DRAFT_395836 [Trichoderma ceciliae]